MDLPVSEQSLGESEILFWGFTGRGLICLFVRHRLYGQWGIVDRDDMISGAKALADKGLVDPKKIGIMGSSGFFFDFSMPTVASYYLAGGYLLLSCLLNSDIFAAAVSHYGVADLEALAKVPKLYHNIIINVCCQDTHKFELGYNAVCIAPYPEGIDIYKERSPSNHIDRLY